MSHIWAEVIHQNNKILINFSLKGGTIIANDQLGKLGFTYDDFKENLVLLMALF